MAPFYRHDYVTSNCFRNSFPCSGWVSGFGQTQKTRTVRSVRVLPSARPAFGGLGLRLLPLPLGYPGEPVRADAEPPEHQPVPARHDRTDRAEPVRRATVVRGEPREYLGVPLVVLLGEDVAQGIRDAVPQDETSRGGVVLHRASFPRVLICLPSGLSPPVGMAPLYRHEYVSGN